MCQWPASVCTTPSLCSGWARGPDLCFYLLILTQLLEENSSNRRKWLRKYIANLFHSGHAPKRNTAVLAGSNGWKSTRGHSSHSRACAAYPKKPQKLSTANRHWKTPSVTVPVPPELVLGILWYQPLWLASGQAHTQKGEVAFFYLPWTCCWSSFANRRKQTGCIHTQTGPCKVRPRAHPAQRLVPEGAHSGCQPKSVGQADTFIAILSLRTLQPPAINGSGACQSHW